jgi:sugar-specific transcriptional regulator TrmB
MNSSLRNFLLELGLTFEEAEIYTSLLKDGNLTILDVARRSGINRTKIYRILESMISQGLISEITEGKKKLLKAADLSNFEAIINKKEKSIQSLKSELPKIIEEQGGRASLALPATKIQSYTNKSGFEAFTAKILTQKKVLGLCRKPSDIIHSLSKTGADIRIIVNVSESKLGSKVKVLAQSVFKISSELYIYGDTVGFVYNLRDQTYSIEISNEEFVALQKQLFENLWNLAF